MINYANNQGIRYAGIGSRKTPKSMAPLMRDAAFYLSDNWDATLVSGGASGADTFFEYGCDCNNGKKEIWLPELGFNGSTSTLLPSKPAFIIAERFVPHWSSCNAWARAAHARNSHQVLGEDLMQPVNFILCWTPGGAKVGGTATALSIAEEFNVPVFNFGSPFNDENDRRDQLLEFIEEHAAKKPINWRWDGQS
jgi:hypothetical protein